MAQPASGPFGVPIAPTGIEGLRRLFKRPREVQGPLADGPARNDLPTLSEYLKGMGYKNGDAVFDFVPMDRDIRVAGSEVSPKIAPDSPLLKQKGLGDSIDTMVETSSARETKTYHTIHMRSALDTMQERFSRTLGFKPETMQGVDNKQLHLQVLFHEVGHTEPGNLALPTPARETNADMYGINAVQAQYPGSKIADVVRNWRFIENGYNNGTLLDRTLKGQPPSDDQGVHSLAKAHQNTSGHHPRTVAAVHKIASKINNMELGTPGVLSKTFARATSLLNIKPEKRIQNLQKSINAGKDDPLIAEAKQGTIDAYKALSPKMAGKALSRVKTPTRAATGPVRPG